MISMHFIWLRRISRLFTFACSSASCCTTSASVVGTVVLSLSEEDVLTNTIDQFKLYAGSGEYTMLEAYSAKQVVATVNADVAAHIYAHKPVKTTDVHGNRLPV
jgi:hypothetical protein